MEINNETKILEEQMKLQQQNANNSAFSSGQASITSGTVDLFAGTSADFQADFQESITDNGRISSGEYNRLKEKYTNDTGKSFDNFLSQKISDASQMSSDVQAKVKANSSSSTSSSNATASPTAPANNPFAGTSDDFQTDFQESISDNGYISSGEYNRLKEKFDGDFDNFLTNNTSSDQVGDSVKGMIGYKDGVDEANDVAVNKPNVVAKGTETNGAEEVKETEVVDETKVDATGTATNSDFKATVNGGFNVQDGKIIGPDGKEFVPHGFNIGGDNYWTWDHDESGDIDELKAWGVNSVRMVNYSSSDEHQKLDNFKEYVEKFTDAGIAVMLEDHTTTGKYLSGSELESSKNWYKEQAQNFKGNSLVWFDTGNEPGRHGDSTDQWMDFQSEMIEAIRSTGNDNMIVVNEQWWGQGAGGKNSAVLERGKELTNKYGDNIVFSPHIYSEFDAGKLDSYLKNAKSQGLAVTIGEFGERQADYVPEVAMNNNVGALAWLWDGTGDFNGNFRTTTGTNRGAAFEINDLNNPTNLNEYGEKMWNYLRTQE
jgi:hypothetical protein